MNAYHQALVAALLLTGCTVGTVVVPGPFVTPSPEGTSGAAARGTAVDVAASAAVALAAPASSVPAPTSTATPPAVKATPTPAPTRPPGVHPGDVDAQQGGEGVIRGSISGDGYASVVVNILRADTGALVVKAPGYSLGGKLFGFGAYGLKPGRYVVVPTTHLATITFDKGRIEAAITENNTTANADVTGHLCTPAGTYRTNATSAAGSSTPPPCVTAL